MNRNNQHEPLRLRCLLCTPSTLTVHVLNETGDKFINDHRTIHMLKQSMFALISKHGKKVTVTEISPEKLGIVNDYSAVPDFGFGIKQCVWISPDAIHHYGKEQAFKTVSERILEKIN